MPRVSYVKAADLFLIVSFAFTFFALLETVIVYKAASSASKTAKKVTPKKAKVEFILNSILLLYSILLKVFSFSLFLKLLRGKLKAN